MNINLDLLAERFDKSMIVLKQNMGPQLTNRTQLGLTPGQVFMLHFIRKESQCNVSLLADKMEVAPSAISVMLDRLENQGLVSRTRNKADRRVVIITLTEEGKRKLNEVLEVRRKILHHCFKQMEPDHLNTLIESLEKLSSIVQVMEIRDII